MDDRNITFTSTEARIAMSRNAEKADDGAASFPFHGVYSGGPAAATKENVRLCKGVTDVHQTAFTLDASQLLLLLLLS